MDADMPNESAVLPPIVVVQNKRTALREERHKYRRVSAFIGGYFF